MSRALRRGEDHCHRHRHGDDDGRERDGHHEPRSSIESAIPHLRGSCLTYFFPSDEDPYPCGAVIVEPRAGALSRYVRSNDVT